MILFIARLLQSVIGWEASFEHFSDISGTQGTEV